MLQENQPSTLVQQRLQYILKNQTESWAYAISGKLQTTTMDAFFLTWGDGHFHGTNKDVEWFYVMSLADSICAGEGVLGKSFITGYHEIGLIQFDENTITYADIGIVTSLQEDGQESENNSNKKRDSEQSDSDCQILDHPVQKGKIGSKEDLEEKKERRKLRQAIEPRRCGEAEEGEMQPPILRVASGGSSRY
ncbi:hypothetical protein RND71_035155 [Anisodus tanguticus]|uniref:Transcription factor n=1 Tax=Anisodus tanguticus TaxID=243964 RepID=A0AAE1V1A9_9SOLA|nr:hypothetical protein RND71_035155 [Anisodus tanguticus]